MLKILKGNYIFSSFLSLLLLISLFKLDFNWELRLNALLKETLKLVIILFLFLTLIVISLITSYIIYKRLLLLSLTLIISLILLLIKIEASLVLLRAYY